MAILEIVSEHLILRIILGGFPFVLPVLHGRSSILSHLRYKDLDVPHVSHAQVPIPGPTLDKGVNVVLD